MNYWLFKSEPDAYSIDDLKAEPNSVGVWDGIRNYQARNILRDDVQLGDTVLFYHSSCKKVGIAGVAKVVKIAYPDALQFDPSSKYYDAKSPIDSPRWVCVDIQFKSKLPDLLSLPQLKAVPELSDMMLLKRGRLSVQPVKSNEWKVIKKLAVI